MHKLQAIIFDVDGTLADTEEVHRLAFNHAFAEHGLDWHWSEELYSELLSISGGRERMSAFGRDLQHRFNNQSEFTEFIIELHRAKTRKYAAMLTEGEVSLRPGMRRIIDSAREAGVTMAIATSSAYTNAETLLDNNLPPGWREWFAGIETCDSVETKKPSPAVYLAVLDRLDIAVENVIAFEDTPNGLFAAQKAGVRTVVTTHRFTRDHEFPGAALVVDGAGEPDAPFTVREGDEMGFTYLSLELCDALLIAASENEQRLITRKTA